MAAHRAVPIVKSRLKASLFALIAALAVIVTLVSVAGEPAPGRAGQTSGQAAATARKPFIGTLVTHADTAKRESKAGVKMAMLEVQWKYFEPKRRVVDRKYATWIKTQFRQFRAAGMRVTLGLGLHFTPRWVLAKKANRLIDQHGTVSKQADFVFNRNVRLAANWYIKQLNRVVPLKYFYAVRITSGGDPELLYPTGSFWAWSQGGQSGYGRPTSLARNPRPGWKPGQRASLQQRRAWANWYVGALADVADWQMSMAHLLGFRGHYQVLTPGQGLRVKQWNALMRKGYGDGTLGRGAAWHVVFAHLRHRKQVTVYVSSLADGTADASVCKTSDTKVALSDPQTFYWSAARWLSRIARGYGMTVAGEVGGYPWNSKSRQNHYRDTSGSGLLATAMRQVRACGMLGLYWAHDTQVKNGTMPLSVLSRYT